MLLNAFRSLFSNSPNRKARRSCPPQLLQLEGRVVPATFTVSITGDSGVGSLRDAIDKANNETINPGADTIVFAAGLTAGGAATINLSTSGDGTAGPSAFNITSAITITGPTGSNGITLNNTFVNQRLFYVSGAGGNLTLDSLTLSGGKAQGGNGADGGGGAAGMGGAIFNEGSLSLQNSFLSGNTALGGNGTNTGRTSATGGGGGGVGQDGGSGGTGGADGGAGGGPNGGWGADENYSGGNGYLNGGNGGTGYSGPFGSDGIGGATGGGGGGAGLGGAIFNYQGTVTITNSKFASNKAIGGSGATSGQGLGGSIFNDNGTVTIINSTVPDPYGTITRSTSAARTLSTQSKAPTPDPFSDQDGIFSIADGNGNTSRLTIDNSNLGGDNPEVGSVQVISIHGGKHTTNTGHGNHIGTAFGFGGDTGGLAIHPFITSGNLATGAKNSIPGTQINLYSDSQGTLAKTLTPYPYFNGEVRVALGDNSGTSGNIVTAPGAGGGPHVQILDGQTGNSIANFFAYDPNFTGGVFIATADLNNDGINDIITAPGAGGGPNVKVFDGATLKLLFSFFAYDPSFTGGVSVAVYDFNLDGILDIVTGAGPGGGPQVNIFDGSSHALIQSFYAFDPAFRGGVFVAIGDLFSDGTLDIITGAGAGGAPQVSVFDAQTLLLEKSFLAYDPDFSGGVRVGTYDNNGDGINDLITGPGPGGAPNVRVFSGLNLDMIANFFAGDLDDLRGVFVS